MRHSNDCGTDCLTCYPGPEGGGCRVCSRNLGTDPDDDPTDCEGACAEAVEIMCAVLGCDDGDEWYDDILSDPMVLASWLTEHDAARAAMLAAVRQDERR